MTLYAHPRHRLEDAEARKAMAAFDRLAVLILLHEGEFAAVHAPILVNNECVNMHVARANPIWRAAPCPGLLILPGPEAYISPGWYASKAETGRAVPTWNYEAIHVRGDIAAFEDRDRLKNMVARLSDRHEAGRAAPWTIEEAPEDYLDRLLNGIVGLELTITGIEAKAKLSQEKAVPDQAGVIAGLAASPDPRDGMVAAAMPGTWV